MEAPTARMEVHVRPGSSRDALEGFKDGVLQVRLTARPVEGNANRALLKFLAKKAGIPPGRVRIVAGERGRRKILEFQGLSSDQLLEHFR